MGVAARDRRTFPFDLVTRESSRDSRREFDRPMITRVRVEFGKNSLSSSEASNAAMRFDFLEKRSLRSIPTDLIRRVKIHVSADADRQVPPCVRPAVCPRLPARLIVPLIRLNCFLARSCENDITRNPTRDYRHAARILARARDPGLDFVALYREATLARKKYRQLDAIRAASAVGAVAFVRGEMSCGENAAANSPIGECRVKSRFIPLSRYARRTLDASRSISRKD